MLFIITSQKSKTFQSATKKSTLYLNKITSFFPRTTIFCFVFFFVCVFIYLLMIWRKSNPHSNVISNRLTQQLSLHMLIFDFAIVNLKTNWIYIFTLRCESKMVLFLPGGVDNVVIKIKYHTLWSQLMLTANTFFIKSTICFFFSLFFLSHLKNHF